MITNQKIGLQVGPLTVSLSSNLSSLLSDVKWIYDGSVLDQTSDNTNAFYDFHITVDQLGGFRRWWRPQVHFSLDGLNPFRPLPKSQALALFEWGLNWCIANNCHEYLIIHAAVVEKNGRVLMLSAPPGAGKSTLCAGLVCRGWRLLSDELALLRLDSVGSVMPLARPVSLKNRSIDIIQQFSPDARIGPLCTGTTKGTVAHMLSPAESVKRSRESAKLSWIVFPQYARSSKTIISSRSKAQSFLMLARQAFNFHLLGEQGFSLLSDVVSDVQCYDFQYSDLDEAVEMFDGMALETVTEGMSYAV